ncbi:acyltransferase [Leucobacter coleopterorum]|uniref:Acyltransferase n=1 Tax=Leucobacter coleopterorum TaxID=2714933 RepID=A0ABX6JU86_9MICO|nr:acyltransferase family protein [Leucobacter coleopterorum]QIM17844.1 acyltransferase [Leucobacter coleopterorum]
MTLAAPVSVPASRSTTTRERSVDLVRAACLLAVVGVHALMVGVSVQGGIPVLENALESWSGFTEFSWFAQMMPLFFILGGFASATHYRRVRARGVTPSAYVATRLCRLLPAPLAAAGPPCWHCLGWRSRGRVVTSSRRRGGGSANPSGSLASTFSARRSCH